MRRLPLLFAGLLSFALACGEEPSAGEVLLDYEGFAPSRVGDLEGVRVLLHARDARGRPAKLRVRVNDETGERVLVESPAPMRCEGGQCRLSFELDAGSYALHLEVFAQDRCGTEALLARLFPTGDTQLRFGPRESRFLVFGDADLSFDDDADGIENALELPACGRFDVPDLDLPAQVCLDDEHPCCKSAPTDLIGRMTRFDGSPAHRYLDGNDHEVGPFLLDATEVTWGTLERCVLAGACLQGKPSHPARRALDDATLDRALPARGLFPAEADALCRWLGKELPTDLQWDFAAAHRAPGVRARFPWDEGDTSNLVDDEDGLSEGPAPLPPTSAPGCAPTDPPPAANHQGAGGGCPDGPLPVGSYPQSHARRGHGPPVADLAGNAFEWTLEPPAMLPEDAPQGDPRVPPGVTVVYLRGGSFESPAQLLENDLRLRISNLERDLDDFAAVAGFRCAAPLPDDETEAAAIEASFLPAEEPACEAAGE